MNNFPTLEMAPRNDSPGADAHLCFEDTQKVHTRTTCSRIFAREYFSFSRLSVLCVSRVCMCYVSLKGDIMCDKFSCDSMLRELDEFWVSLPISACYDRAAARE